MMGERQANHEQRYGGAEQTIYVAIGKSTIHFAVNHITGRSEIINYDPDGKRINQINEAQPVDNKEEQ